MLALAAGVVGVAGLGGLQERLAHLGLRGQQADAQHLSGARSGDGGLRAHRRRVDDGFGQATVKRAISMAMTDKIHIPPSPSEDDYVRQVTTAEPPPLLSEADPIALFDGWLR